MTTKFGQTTLLDAVYRDIYIQTVNRYSFPNDILNVITFSRFDR